MSTTRPQLIYCAGGNPTFADIATSAGFHYGLRLPGTAYAPVSFADQEYVRPDRTAYMAKLAQHRPALATVLDLERAEQFTDVLAWAEEAAQHVERVIVIPKCEGVIECLPRQLGRADVVLGYSVPTGYGACPLDLLAFRGWPVHVLGGSPQQQMRLWRSFSRFAEVVSADGNMHQLQANRCRVWTRYHRWSRDGHFRQLRDFGLGSYGRDSNSRAFAMSCANIWAAWHGDDEPYPPLPPGVRQLSL